ncbi:MAG: hypothetical protein HN348_35770, partial [Proteobacteria bacterium]|nr:hypothetical protein [Pseudomonadota bacterium]
LFEIYVENNCERYLEPTDEYMDWMSEGMNFISIQDNSHQNCVTNADCLEGEVCDEEEGECRHKIPALADVEQLKGFVAADGSITVANMDQVNAVSCQFKCLDLMNMGDDRKKEDPYYQK